MKRRWSNAFPAEPESSHARSARIGRAAGDQDKRRTNVTFIACPADKQDFSVNRNRCNLMRAVHNVIEAGADIVNISLSRTAITDATANMSSLLTELTSTFDVAWISSAAQPAYSSRTVGSVMSFFVHSRVNLLSESIVDPEAGLPAILLIFSAPEGRLCTITGSLPTLPRKTRERLLASYCSAAANTKPNTILIGLACSDAILFMENQIAKLDLDFDMSSNENLCVLAHCSDRTSTQCIAMDTQSVFSFIAPVGAAQSYRNSAERPVPTANAITLRPATPLYDSLIEDLENAVKQHPRGHRFIDYLTKSCFFGDLLTI